MAKPSDKVTIKKYANRRLYDTESSAYITLDRLSAMIREGREFEVLDAAMDAFQLNQSAMRDALGGNMLADLAKRNMAVFGDASRVLTPKPRSEDDKPSTTEVEQLRSELAALQAKVDRLNR
jgi:polyhydroxyalkanoate synthesis regulator protein